MNIMIDLAKFEPGPTFKKTINEIKDDINEIKHNHLKSIASADMNISDITSFEENFDPLSIDNSF